MKKNQVKDPEEVLVRSKQIPDLPFKGSLNYKGIQTVATVFGIHKQNGIGDISEDQIPNENFSVPAKHGTRIVLREKVYEREVAETRADLVTLWTKIQKNQKYAFILYKTKNKENSGNNKYVVALDFRFVYEIVLDECSTTFLCREMNSHIKLPKSTPDNRLTGKFSDLSEGQYTEDKNLIKFEKPPKLLGLFGSCLEINLEMVELDNIHSLYELKGEKNIEISNGNEVGEYCSAEVSVSNGDYILKCDHPDGIVTFRFELTKFGTLPDWVEERVNINTLINHLDRDESIIVEVRDAKESTESKWISELQDKEIIGVR